MGNMYILDETIATLLSVPAICIYGAAFQHSTAAALARMHIRVKGAVHTNTWHGTLYEMI